MRDHRLDMTPADRALAERELIDITEEIRRYAPKMQTTKSRAAKRRKRKQTVQSRRANR